MNSISGISWERLEAQSAVTYPCRTEDDPGQSVVFTENFEEASASALIARWEDVLNAGNISLATDKPANSAGAASLL